MSVTESDCTVKLPRVQIPRQRQARAGQEAEEGGRRNVWPVARSVTLALCHTTQQPCRHCRYHRRSPLAHLYPHSDTDTFTWVYLPAPNTHLSRDACEQRPLPLRAVSSLGHATTQLCLRGCRWVPPTNTLIHSHTRIHSLHTLPPRLRGTYTLATYRFPSLFPPVY